jgi:hypothetical protein
MKMLAPVRAFTVKHELRSWLSAQPEWMVREQMVVYRMGDGGWPGKEPAEMDISKILEGK